MSGYPTFTSIPRVDGLSTDPRFWGVTPAFLELIQGDICGSIHPPSGPFCYLLVLIDASTRWFHVCLLSTGNVAFSRLLAQILQLKTQFHDHPIKTIHLDNASEFSSQAFLDYCMSIGIDV